MYTSKFDMKQVFLPCDGARLDSAEQDLGIRLPKEFRDFLLEWNGVIFYPQDVGFRFTDGQGFEVLREIVSIYGLAPVYMDYDFRREQRGYQFVERVPPNIIAIGSGVREDRICISVAGIDKGAVYSWHPGLDFEDGPNVQTMDYLARVASSFREFWELLEPFVDEE